MRPPMTTTLLMVCVLSRECDIGGSVFKDMLLLLPAGLLHDPAGNTDNNGSLRYFHALCDHRTCPDDRSRTDMGPVEHDCPHPDKHPVIDPAPVEDCPVAYGHVVPDDCREPLARM